MNEKEKISRTVVQPGSRTDSPEFKKLTDGILDACFAVHREMGPGLNESVYKACLMKELELNKIPYVHEAVVPVYYKGVLLDQQFKVDLLIDDEVILELKAVSELTPIFEAQLLNYLKLSKKTVGYLINFNVPLLKLGIKRMKNGY